MRELAGTDRKLIGEVVFDPARNELTVAGETKPLEPRLVRLLEELCAAGGAPVPREQLLASVSTLPYAGDEALTQAMSKLRQALGDDPRRPRYIKTIPRRGYALIATIADYHEEQESPDGPVMLAGGKQHAIFWYSASAAIFLLAVFVGYLLYISRTSEIEIEFHEKSQQEFIEKQDMKPEAPVS
ncbi:winged helix-turn-helix domain-containing protein [Kordiimonas sp.]|uniref:winged helix-turn-helix domain-containing protein n=1 Tax=Kordiimonas sp. TaxID=1970157 RepID=UPI003A8DA489